MARLLLPMSMVSLLSVGAIFGFFYAWICSTMWGLDAVEPKVAITAMRAMNASVGNPVFFPAFFLTPLLLGATAFIARSQGRKRSAILFAAAAMVYLFGALVLTVSVNVPMNETLAQVSIPQDPAAAAQIWQAYSAPWQTWNTIRTLNSGLALLLTGFAILLLNKENT